MPDATAPAPLDIHKIAGSLGAEVRGVDLAQPLPETRAEALRAALAEHLVLFLRGQALDMPAQKRATELFGPVFRVPYVEGSSEDPDVIAVLKEAEERKIGVFGGDWHSDFSFLERPPGGSLLHAIQVPPYGGDTLWSNQIEAWETLPDDLKEILEGRGAVHVGKPHGVKWAPKPGAGLSKSVKMRRGDPEADKERVHPAVRRHLPSGRRALFVNPIYTTRLEGLSEADSAPILERIARHAIRPEFTCRWRWQDGDLAIWDNRATLHYAINDYDGHRRLLHRTTFAGEVPVG